MAALDSASSLSTISPASETVKTVKLETDGINTAFGMFGMSYTSNYKHWHANMGNVQIDFRKSIAGYHKDLLNGRKYDCFLSTYDHELRNELLDAWKPKQFVLAQKVLSNRFYSRNMHVSNICRLILDSQRIRGKPYDTVILTRFDLEFIQRPFELAVNLKRLNLSAKCERDPLIDDNIYIMPGSMLPAFYNIIEENWNKSAHHIRDKFEASLGPINFLVYGFYLVSKNPVYKIIRSGKDGQVMDSQKVPL